MGEPCDKHTEAVSRQSVKKESRDIIYDLATPAPSVEDSRWLFVLTQIVREAAEA